VAIRIPIRNKVAINRLQNLRIKNKLEINPKRMPHPRKPRRMLSSYKLCSMLFLRICMNAKKDFSKAIVK